MSKQSRYTKYIFNNSVEDKTIKTIDEDREEAPKQYRVTNLPNNLDDVLFSRKADAIAYAHMFKSKNNLSNPIVENIWEA